MVYDKNCVFYGIGTIKTGSTDNEFLTIMVQSGHLLRKAFLFDKYNVSYIYMGNSERNNYGISSEEAFLQNFEVEYQSGDVTLYRRK